MPLIDLTKYNLQQSSGLIKLYAGSYGVFTKNIHIWHPLAVTAYSRQEAIKIAFTICRDTYQGDQYFDYYADMIEVPHKFIDQAYKAALD